MRILIDGYNLLHEIGFHGDLSESGELEVARVRMLDKLSEYLTEEERRNTIIIFDAGSRSPKLDRQYTRHSIQVEFAVDYLDADAKIQELIRSNNVPKQLLVISSDHRIQRTAKARRANFLDSDQWLDLLESRSESDETETVAKAPSKTEPQNDYWMELFSSVSVKELNEELNSSDLSDVDEDEDEGEDGSSDGDDKPSMADDLDIFPPGYGEDLLG